METYTELDLKEIGDRVQRRRWSMGMSISECARRANINRGTMYNIEDGKGCMSLEIANRMTQVLGFRGIDDLVGVDHDVAGHS